VKKILAALIANPMTYVLGFSIVGAASIVCGVAFLAGPGWALVTAGSFLIAAAGFITRGMSPNG
jgi:hypothetical protein